MLSCVFSTVEPQNNPLVVCRRHFCFVFGVCCKVHIFFNCGFTGLFATMVRSQPTLEKGKRPIVLEDYDDLIPGTSILNPNYSKQVYFVWSLVVAGGAKLAPLSSKSTCNFHVAFGVQGTLLASAFLCPVCSHS